MKWIKGCLALAWSFSVCVHVAAGEANMPWPTQRLEANLGEGCRFAVTLLGKKGVRVPSDSAMTAVGGDPKYAQGGMVAAPYPAPWKSKSHMTSIRFNLRCEDAREQLESKGLAKFNTQKGIWEKDVSGRFELDGGKLASEDYQLYDQATRLYNIVAVNSNGYVATEEDVIGDEEKRERRLNFCVFHGSKALCGMGSVAYLADGSKGDLTPYALEMIRSIEFLEDIAPVL